MLQVFVIWVNAIKEKFSVSGMDFVFLFESTLSHTKSSDKKQKFFEYINVNPNR